MKVHVTKHKTGKLKGFLSINTSSLENPFCALKSLRAESVCSHCYARRLSSIRPTLEKRLKQNLELLREPLKPEDFPEIPEGSIVRLHSYGELVNSIHAKNFYEICNRNPNSLFALWTKRPSLLIPNKPPNLILIYSVSGLDQPEDSVIFERDLVDKVFFVDTEDHGQINCQRQCSHCMICYTKQSTDTIHELLRR